MSSMSISTPRGSDEVDPSAVYEDRWGVSGRVVQLRPHLWRELAPEVASGRVLEIGPGLRPTAPARGSYFVETSENATLRLRAVGGRSVRVGGWRLPFRDRVFRGVLALEILEHLEEDERLLGEIVRVLEPGGVAAISVPLHMERWTAVDEMVHHVRRYEPDELLRKIQGAGLRPERFSARPSRSHPVMARVGVSVMTALPRASNWWLQHVVFPVHAAWQRRVERVGWRTMRESIPANAGGALIWARAP